MLQPRPHRLTARSCSTSVTRASTARAGITMGMAPHVKCCGCCCTLHMGAMIGTGLYILLEIVFTIIFPLIWQPRGVKESKAFCKGTTVEYRKGNDVNSALTPSITLHP